MSRSYLFIPGNTPAMIQNLDVFESDCIIIDLEDSVTVTDKDAARILVSTFLDNYKFKGIEIYIRINDSQSEFFLKDIEILNLEFIYISGNWNCPEYKIQGLRMDIEDIFSQPLLNK